MKLTWTGFTAFVNGKPYARLERQGIENVFVVVRHGAGVSDELTEIAARQFVARLAKGEDHDDGRTINSAASIPRKIHNRGLPRTNRGRSNATD